MGKLWVLLLQAVLAGVVMFILAATIAPESLPWRERTVVIGGDAVPTVLERRDGLVSYSAGALRASPSVVSIYAAKAPPRRLPGMPSPFAEPGEEPGGGGGLGSGVVMSADGYVLTNNHVVEGAGTVAVAFGEGKPAPARIVGTDPETDLALLKVEARDLTAITLGDSDALRIGDVVLAIGNPFGVGQTTTQGIVSGTGRNRVGINTFENFIQTDAAINPGNSGGALVDAAGRLVGINTAILSPSGGSLGIGFAIPVRTATEVLSQLIKEGRVARGWIGVEAQDLTRQIAQALGLRAQAGSVLVRLLRGGPADRAGLRPGDLVAALDGEPIADTRDLIEKTAAIKPGGQGKLTVLRGETELQVQVEVGRRPPLASGGGRR